ncbi:MAG: putative addiction module antidote protein [Nitrococcus sp.]|nr:putative addiction module antidote protein [Nitrococcus sp.]
MAGRARIQARVECLAAGNAGRHQVLKSGVCELQIDVVPGCRVYYTTRANELTILLCGGDSARAKGMSELARATGLGRESLYKALSGERNPEFGTILKVLKALGLELHATVAGAQIHRVSGPTNKVRSCE